MFRLSLLYSCLHKEENQAKSNCIVGIIVEEKVANVTIFVVGDKCAVESTRRIYMAVLVFIVVYLSCILVNREITK